jgi:hypothetical protein
MREFTSLDLTSAGIAKVRTLKNVTFSTTCPFIAVAIEAEASAHWSSWGRSGVSIRTIILGTMAFGEMQAVGSALGSHVMGKITKLAVDTLSVFQNIFTESNLVGIVNVAATRAFGA